MFSFGWFRFEWQFGVGVVATLILDVTKTVGFFGVTQLQFDLTSVAALLTLIGYSVTDKVVVYDRIRENLGKHRTMPLRQLIDLSFIASPILLFLGEKRLRPEIARAAPSTRSVAAR